MHEIDIIVGTRPNFVKAAPLISLLINKKIPFKLVHSGQHYDETLFEQMFFELQLPSPNIYFQLKGTKGLGVLSKSIDNFFDYFGTSPANNVIVFGDVDTTIAAAIAAKRAKKTLIHVEAGLRSHDHNMPEELNRLMVDSISDLFICTESSAVDNLLNEGISANKISLIGNLMIDNLHKNIDKIGKNFEVFDAIGVDKSKKYAVVTLHREAICSDVEGLTSIFAALNEISQEFTTIVVWHPRLKKALKNHFIKFDYKLKFIDPLPYITFLELWIQSNIVLTDSGGLQEETSAVSLECLTLRPNTERPITISHGTNKLVGTNTDAILKAFSKCKKVKLSDIKLNNKIPFWDGYASNRLLEFLNNQNILTGL